MSIKDTTIRTVAVLLATSAPVALLAQAPVATDVELTQARRIPAEQQAAVYRDADWAAPRTSWGHPSLQGTYSTDDMRGIPRNRPEDFGT